MTNPALKVAKISVPVIVYTATHRLEGTYFMRPEGRLTDDLNSRRKHFVPLMDVVVTPAEKADEAGFRCDFLAVSLQSIVLFCPNPKAVDAAGRRGEPSIDGREPAGARTMAAAP